MRKIIAGINMTIDGICDHTAGIPDEQLHQHYTTLLNNADVILYGSITFQLMKFWQTLLDHPSGEKSMDDFATAINKIKKIIFSHTLESTEWDTAKLASQPIEEIVSELKQQSGRDVLVGSRSLIIQLLNLNLIDEFQLCIHPVVTGSGLPLFENINDKIAFHLINTKTFSSGVVIHYYKPIKITNH